MRDEQAPKWKVNRQRKKAIGGIVASRNLCKYLCKPSRSAINKTNIMNDYEIPVLRN